jgi:hypothetical protein
MLVAVMSPTFKPSRAFEHRVTSSSNAHWSHTSSWLVLVSSLWLACGSETTGSASTDATTPAEDVPVTTVDVAEDVATPGPGADTSSFDTVAPDDVPVGTDAADPDTTPTGTEDTPNVAEDGGASDDAIPTTACAPDHCEIDGACIPNGAAHPTEPCRVCLVPVRRDAWTNDDAASCSDGDGCTVDRCQSG